MLESHPTLRQAGSGKIKLEFNAVHSNHLRVTKKDQGLVGKCRAAVTLSVQKVGSILVWSNMCSFSKWLSLITTSRVK